LRYSLFFRGFPFCLADPCCPSASRDPFLLADHLIQFVFQVLVVFLNRGGHSLICEALLFRSRQISLFCGLLHILFRL
jgi:hypothetical protein